MNVQIFNPECNDCQRLSGFLEQVSGEHPSYHARPVAPFGDDNARLLVVGLAPGMHGANATGRPFTGDHAGIMLYQTLFEYGFGSKSKSVSCDDDLVLTDCRITNAVKCLPPQNKPLLDEIKACNHYLRSELESLPADAVIVALGKIAHDAVLRAMDLKLAAFPFGHDKVYSLAKGKTLIDSYHCSRYNTQTRRLTDTMFSNIFRRARTLLDECDV